MYMFWKSHRTAITHSGSFHADDVVAISILKLIDPNIKVIRTRDKKVIESKKADDIVLDVGYAFDPEKFLFDHHQPSYTERRSNGLGYASAGLIWKYFGKQLCDDDEKVWDRVDQKLIQSIDADDLGVLIYQDKDEYNGPYTLPKLIDAFKPVWSESLSHDDQFFKAVEIVKEVLKREIIRAKSFVLAQEEVKKAYEQAADKRIIVLDKSYPFQEVLQEFSEPLFIVANDGVQTTWCIKTIGIKGEGFASRKLLPEAWAGKNGKEFENASGVMGANFCHKDRFIAVANSKEGAVKLAEIAANA